MVFEDLIVRVYDVLGDYRPRPRLYPLDRIKRLLNEGFRQFRLRVQDRWIETEEALVALQAIYTIPARTVRIVRIAYKDRTMSPVTLLELVSSNHRWQEASPVDTPRLWTTEDVAYDEYRIYPPPANASAVATQLSQESGVLARWVDALGVNATFNQDHGFVARSSQASIVPDAGLSGNISSIGAGVLTLWLVDGTPDLQGEQEDIPIPGAWYMAPVYWAISESYAEMGDHSESQLRQYYESRFEDEIKIASKAFSEYMSHMLVGIGANLTVGLGSGDITFPSEVVAEGITRSVIWGRHCLQDDGDGFYGI